MGFHERDWPYNPDWGVLGGPRFRDARIELGSGQVEVAARWQNEQNVYNATYAIRRPEEMYGAFKFLRARGWTRNGFRWKDWSDYTSNSDDGRAAPDDEDQLLGIGDGTTVLFQLKKRYQDGGFLYDRTIHKVVPNSVVVSFDQVAQASSSFAVNSATGQVLFGSAPSADVEIRCGFEFAVPVQLDLDDKQALQRAVTRVDAGEIPVLPLVEMKNAADVSQDWWYPGGSQPLTAITTAQTLSLLNGRVIPYQSTSVADLAINLPSPDGMPDGPDIFVVINAQTSTQNLKLKDQAGTTLMTIAPANAARVDNVKDSSGNGQWYAR